MARHVDERGNMQFFEFNLSTFFTFLRLLLSPFVAFYLVWYFPTATSVFPFAFFYIFLCLTDFIDGYSARAWGQETIIGRLCDPLADKFLLLSTVIGMVAIQQMAFYWALLIVGREIFVMGLREIALYCQFSIPVIKSAKLKTFLQGAYFSHFFLCPSQGILKEIESVLFVAMILVSLFSATLYTRFFFQEMRKNRI